MSLAIVGSRTFDDYELLKQTIDRFIDGSLEKPTTQVKGPMNKFVLRTKKKKTRRNTIHTIVSGGAQGADQLGEQYAKEKELKAVILKPDWKQYGKAAGFIRNKDIVAAADYVIAFWDGQSKGTLNSINHAKKMKKELFIIRF